MAVSDTTDSQYLLPCGRGIEQVWEHLDTVADGLADRHEAGCPYCTSARESLVVLRTATRELVGEPDPPPSDLFGRIMSAVRSDVRRGRTLTVPTPYPGGISVSEQAIAVVLRYAADTVDGVRARGCQVRSSGAGPDGIETLTVTMTLAVRLSDLGIEELVGRVRGRVRAAAANRAGLTVDRIDITVADVYQEA